MSAIPQTKPGTNPYAPPRARVRDVAAKKVALLPAERSTRLGAAFLDSLIFSAVFMVPMVVAMMIAASSASSSTTPGAEAAEAAGGVLAGGLAVGLIGFLVLLWMTLKQMNETGQSLAKKWLNIKVVRSDGSPASLGNLIWKRNVINWLLGIIPLYSLIEVLFIFGEERQCLHDKIADTIVVQA